MYTVQAALTEKATENSVHYWLNSLFERTGLLHRPVLKFCVCYRVQCSVQKGGGGECTANAVHLCSTSLLYMTGLGNKTNGMSNLARSVLHHFSEAIVSLSEAICFFFLTKG